MTLDQFIEANGGTAQSALAIAKSLVQELETKLGIVKWDTSRKTTREWFIQAEKFGFTWAQSALAQTDEYALDLTRDSLIEALGLFATWDATKEGGDYWRKLYSTIEKMKL
jgi:hypothetical protein